MPPRPPRRGDVAEHHLIALRPSGSDLDTAQAASILATPELFPGVADTHLLTECPTVDAAGGPIPLLEWLRYDPHVDPWPVVVSRFYNRAAADPQIAGFFTGDMEWLWRYFLAALMIVTGQGVTVGVVRRMPAAHASVRNPSGEPITEATWKAVIGVLAGVLGELGTPPATLVALAATIAPIRAVIVTELASRFGERRARPGRLQPAHPVRHIIDRHRNDGEHICLGCGQSWPCFEFGTALDAMDLVLRVHVAARREPDPPPRQHRRPLAPKTSGPARTAAVRNDTDVTAAPADPT